MVESDPAACPSPETLGAFIDGTVDAGMHRSVQRHLALCPECVFVVAGTSRVRAATEDNDSNSQDEVLSSRRWLVAVAAAIVAVCGIAAWYVSVVRDPLKQLQSEAERAPFRTVEGRLAGFRYARFRVPRSDATTEDGKLRIEAERVIRLKEGDARTCHARGIAALLLDRHDDAVSMLERAARLAPWRAGYWNDLAVARLAAHRDTNPQGLEAARLAAERAIHIDDSLAAAHFNRALVLDRIGARKLAVRAYDRCITLNGRSEWGVEARRRRDALTR